MFVTSIPDSRVQRKILGAWYTPRSMAKLLVQWAVRFPGDHVLDPAVGDGVFLEEAARLLKTKGNTPPGHQLHGIDISPDAVRASRSLVAGVLNRADSPNLQVGDFFSSEPPDSRLVGGRQVDAVVGNPPYVRYQTFGKQARALARHRAARAGVHLTNLCSAWAPFVVHAISFLATGGRLALVLPEELLHALYASAVRDYVRRSFRLTVVVQFDGGIFPEAQERVVFLLADGRGERSSGELRLARSRSPEDIIDLSDLIEHAEVYPAGVEPQKWMPGFEDSGSLLLARLVEAGFLVPLRSIGKASIGYVTGANDYFVLSAALAAGIGFPKHTLKHTIISARQVPGAVLSGQDLKRLEVNNERCLLWNGGGARVRGIARYIKEGEKRGIDKRYKCKVREPWYVVPGVVQPHAFLTYMSDEIPRLVLNDAAVTCSNTLLTVQLDRVPSKLRAAFVLAFYNSATMLSAERTGRSYGGGVLKLEPSEADRLLVPNPRLLLEVKRPKLLLRCLDSFLRAGRVNEALKQADRIFLQEICGIHWDDLSLIETSRTKRYEARKRKTAT